ncbi:MAG: BatA domain-containing protein [Verrucomicrobiota bacterium]|nr:BatA domain-containing protein [Verrucomicrobiota bacterium]
MLPQFLNPWMLTGLLLISVPIVIHFLNRSRFKIERWGAMMFLRRAARARSRRIRLERILLLLLRCLFLALFALALARPVTNAGGGAGNEPTTHVVVVDGSYSMNQGTGRDNAFLKAREAALALVAGMKDDDNMLVIVAGNRPKLLFPTPSFDRKFLREKIEALKPGLDQTLDMPKTIEQAYWSLEQSSLPRHRIYLFTDGQAHGWRGDEPERWECVARHRGLLKVKPGTYVFRQTPETPALNLAVVKVYPRAPLVDVFRPVKFLVEVANYGRDSANARVEFLVDGAVCGRRDAVCGPGITTLEFDHSFTPAAGAPQWSEVGRVSWRHAAARLGDDDDLAVDNAACVALEVRHALPVLVVEGREADRSLDAEGGLLSLALSSANEPGQPGLFDVTRRSLAELQEAGAQSLELYKAVVLANVPSLSRQFQFSLEQFVENGGGLLVTLGDLASADFYNKWSGQGHGLIPAVLKVVRTCRDRPYRPRFPAGAAERILDVFDPGQSHVLGEVRVEKYWLVEPAGDATGLGFFDDAPFLLYRRYGSGRVVLWTTSANMKWTNFPRTQDYLPLLQNLITYLSVGIQPPINLGQDETLVYSAPVAAVRAANRPSARPGGAAPALVWTVTDPDGFAHPIEPKESGGRYVIEWPETTQPGIYTVTAQGIPPKCYAVSLRPGEGDLAPLPAEARARLPEPMINRWVANAAELDAAVASEEGAKAWWRRLVFLALIALCGELFLGWRFNG